MTARRTKWYLTAGGILAIVSICAVVFGMCRDAGLATPLDAAPKSEVAELREELGEVKKRLGEVEKGQTAIKGRLDMLLHHFEIRYQDRSGNE